MNDMTPGPEQSLVVWNRSQFELLELKEHWQADYASSSNLLNESLQIDEQFEIVIESGSYLTVIRPRLEYSSETIALSTSQRLWLEDNNTILAVFDESFRLIEP